MPQLDPEETPSRAWWPRGRKAVPQNSRKENLKEPHSEKAGGAVHTGLRTERRGESRESWLGCSCGSSVRAVHSEQVPEGVIFYLFFFYYYYYQENGSFLRVKAYGKLRHTADRGCSCWPWGRRAWPVGRRKRASEASLHGAPRHLSSASSFGSLLLLTLSHHFPSSEFATLCISASAARLWGHAPPRVL